MAKLVHGLWLLCALVIQVYSMKNINGLDNSTETDVEFRFLFNVQASQCRAKLQSSSAALPFVTVTLTKLSNNHRYFFAPTTAVLTFDAAVRFCKDHGMELVTINSEKENELVFTEAVARGLAGPAPGTGAWIGLRDVTLNFVFKWILTGKGNSFNFFNAPPTATQCVQYVPATASAASNSWVSAACGGTFPFICELEPPCSVLV